ncbi:malate dehydrogenase [Rickettsiales endosymbiont of Trichoplax sp. H2]|uniref:malate dehydrogenase n=1 Tax=Rickettsiales endosymbiont of Trichoplax sp. H2 TaxID=2021221 RepID=UPI0012B436EE|nr:malate dehydrogenase [Rickettsiales endosymbiont of Trichoplax sp. H2]MSO13858.1 malate dehydrogenase [Rickettsiales endosymbiont of Trichoplax sp. H2]
MRKKIALIGGGNIGGTLAYIAASKEIGDIVILDRSKEYAAGKALDIEESLPVMKKDVTLVGTDDYSDIKDSDLVIITAGVARKPGMSRDDLLSVNAGVIKVVAEGVKKYAPSAFVIVITNPLDAIVYAFLKYSGFSRKKVIGMAGVLDSARFNLFLARELNASVKDIKSFVLGGHGDTMVPLIRYTNIGGVPLLDLIKQGRITSNKVQEIVERTKSGGAEIVKLLKNGSAFYAPATSAIRMAISYLNNSRQLFPCSVYLEGEYGLNDICMGVPTFIGANGVEDIVQITFNQEEQAIFDKSAKAVGDLITAMQKVLN